MRLLIAIKTGLAALLIIVSFSCRSTALPGKADEPIYIRYETNYLLTRFIDPNTESRKRHNFFITYAWNLLGRKQDNVYLVSDSKFQSTVPKTLTAPMVRKLNTITIVQFCNLVNEDYEGMMKKKNLFLLIDENGHTVSYPVHYVGGVAIE